MVYFFWVSYARPEGRAKGVAASGLNDGSADSHAAVALPRKVQIAGAAGRAAGRHTGSN